MIFLQMKNVNSSLSGKLRWIFSRDSISEDNNLYNLKSYLFYNILENI